MPVFSDGQKISAALAWDRLIQSVPASYVIWKDSSTYRAECLLKGGTDYSDADAATAIQAAIDDLTSGGRIFIRKADYPISTELTSLSNIEYLSDGARLYKTASMNAILSGGSSVDNVSIKGLKLDGQESSNYTGYIVYFQGDNIKVEHCELYNSYGFSIHNSNSSENWKVRFNIFHDNRDYNDMIALGGSYVDISHNYFHDTEQVALSTGNVTHLTVSHNILDTVVTGILLETDCHAAAITGNVITDPTTYGIFLNGSAYPSDISYVTITGNVVYGVTKSFSKGIYGTYLYNSIIANNLIRGYGTGTGIEETSNTNYNLIIGNNITNVTTPITAKTTTLVKWNYGSGGHRELIEHHAANDTLTILELGTVHTNLGAGDTITLTLPQDAVKGSSFEFVVMTAQQLRVDPGAAGAVYINGAKQTDDKYVWADDEGESVKLVADGNGDWIALYTQGTWGVEA